MGNKSRMRQFDVIWETSQASTSCRMCVNAFHLPHNIRVRSEQLSFQGANDAFQETRSLHKRRQSVRSISGRLRERAGDSERLSDHGGFYSSGFVPKKKIFVRGNIRWPCRDHYFSSKSKASVWLKGGLLWKRKGLAMRERLWHSVMSEWATDGFVHNVFKCYFFLNLK